MRRHYASCVICTRSQTRFGTGTVRLSCAATIHWHVTRSSVPARRLRMKKPTRISLKKSLWSIGRDQPFDPGHFNSAKESIVESLAHLFGEQKRRALDWRRCQGLGQAWDSYRQLDADIIVNL